MITEYFEKVGNYLNDSLRFIKLLRFLSKNDLRKLNENELVVLKKIIIGNGALSIKFMQWYLSNKEVDNEDNSYSKIIEYFEDVFDNCPYHSIEETKVIFKNEFNTDLDEIIDIDSMENIGSGSIGQVYKCKLNGKIVAMKVKHPNVNKIINNQKDIINIIIYLQKIPFFKNYFDLHYDIKDFMETLYLQLDFKNEVYNTKKICNIFEKNRLVIIPKVLYNSESIIISEYEPGVEFSSLNLYQKLKAGFNFYCAIFEMVIFNDFIHGDLHKKNWKVRMNENKEFQIILYDFGLCFSTGNIKMNKNVWESFEDNNVEKLIEFLEFFIGSHNDNYDIKQDKEFIEKSMREIWSKAFSSELLLCKLRHILREKNLFINKNFSNILILVILVQKTFVEADFTRVSKNSKFDESRNTIHKFNDLLAFTLKYDFYNHTSEYIRARIKELNCPNYLEAEKYMVLDDPLNF